MQHSGGYPRRAPTKARLASARRTEPRASSKRNRGAPHEGDGDGMLFLHRAGMRSTPRRPPHLEAWGSPPVGVNTPGGRRGAGSRDATSLRLRKFWAYAVTVGAGLEGLREERQRPRETVDTCGSNVHTTFDHNDIKWFRRRESLQAKKVESFKASISINKEKDVNDLLRMYDNIDPSVNTPIMPPNMLGADLIGKAVNESRYRGMIGPLMNLTASRPNIQFSTDFYARHQANKESYLNFQLISMLRIFRKPFTRSPNMYKEYLAEFWYSAKTLENSKVFFSTPTGGIYGKVGVNTFWKSIGAHYLPHSSEYVAPPFIDIVRP
ncbi:hypothetical protein Tco_0655210 [Tanacetum coccineum]|uniref:Uncharacterized protein n=1 Tax=Tanacetum coccineum TaxID=301880 RepID=A0ABQ4X5I7_9ASTR